MRLPFLYLSLNASWIKSNVTFPEGSKEESRPMQGQSPYLVNVGLFFNSNQIPNKAKRTQGWTASMLYNVIGKRLIGVGRSAGTGTTEVRVPDSYEKPRHQLDFNIARQQYLC